MKKTFITSLIMKPAFAAFALVLTGLVFFNANQAQAQDAANEDRITFGPKVGFVRGNIAQDFENVADARSGFAGGGFISYRVNDWFSVSGELMYARFGANLRPGTSIWNLYVTDFNGMPQLGIEDFDDIDIAKSSLNMHNVDLNAFAVFHPAMLRGAVQPKLFVGPALAYNMYTRAQQRAVLNIFNPDAAVSQSPEFSANRNWSSRINNWDIGAVIGAGLDFNAHKLKYSIDVRYRAGVSQINAFRNQVNQNDFQSQNILIMFGIGF
jgi:hypothetical protein